MGLRSRSAKSSDEIRVRRSPKPAKLRTASNSGARQLGDHPEPGAALRPHFAREPALHFFDVLDAERFEHRNDGDVVATIRLEILTRATGSAQGRDSTVATESKRDT